MLMRAMMRVLLQYTKRVSVLHEHIKKDFDKGERVSENGVSIITQTNNSNSSEI